MPVVSVTRLQLRSVRFLPQFIVYALRSTAQARRAPGCLGGQTGSEGLTAFWTATVWTSQDAMRAFRNTGVHMRAMPKLLHWCDEASFVHWEQGDAALPDAGEAKRRLSDGGQTSKVAYPSPRHVSGGRVGDSVPRFGNSFGASGQVKSCVTRQA